MTKDLISDRDTGIGLSVVFDGSLNPRHNESLH